MVRKVGFSSWRAPLTPLFIALSHQTRRKILKILVEHPGTDASHLSQMLHLSPSTISEHVAVLAKSTLVTKVRLGKNVILLSNPGKLLTLKKYAELYRDSWEKADRLLQNAKLEDW